MKQRMPRRGGGHISAHAAVEDGGRPHQHVPRRRPVVRCTPLRPLSCAAPRPDPHRERSPYPRLPAPLREGGRRPSLADGATRSRVCPHLGLDDRAARRRRRVVLADARLVDPQRRDRAVRAVVRVPRRRDIAIMIRTIERYSGRERRPRRSRRGTAGDAPGGVLVAARSPTEAEQTGAASVSTTSSDPDGDERRRRAADNDNAAPFPAPPPAPTM